MSGCAGGPGPEARHAHANGASLSSSPEAAPEQDTEPAESVTDKENPASVDTTTRATKSRLPRLGGALAPIENGTTA